MFKSGRHLAFEFKVNRGLRQGDAIAALLFNVVLEIAVRRCNAETGGTIFAKCQIMAYVDDVVIMQTNMIGLEINEKKTKFMIVSPKPYNENEYVKLGTYNFAIVKDYTYFHTVLTNKNELRPEIEKRITNALRAYYTLFSLVRLKQHSEQKK